MAAVWLVLALAGYIYMYPAVQGDISVTTTTVNPVGILGNNEVELVCTYSLAPVDIVFTIAWNRETSKDSGAYEMLAAYYPPGPAQAPATLYNLTYPSVLGRVVVTNPTDSSLTAKIRFTSVVCGDERKYQCTILGLNNGQQINPGPESITSLTVKAKPNATAFNEVQVSPVSNVEEGQTVTFTCTGNVGRPAGTFQWTKYRGTSDPVGTTIHSTTQTSPSTDCTFTGTSVINIPMNKDENGIIVRCALQHETITDPTDTAYYKQTGIINVFYKVRSPTITKSPNTAVHYEKTNLNLTCVAEGNPAPTYVWKLNGTQISTDAQLRLTNIQIAQSGDYVCEATNNFNGNTYTLNSTVSVTIGTPPTSESTSATTTPVPTVDHTSGETDHDGESADLYTAGVVMLSLSVLLLVATAALGIFISRNNGLPCFKTTKMNEANHFPNAQHTVSIYHGENERSQYQQINPADIAGPSVYQMLEHPPNGQSQTVVDRTHYEELNSADIVGPSVYQELTQSPNGYDKSYVNTAFNGNSSSGRT